ncbi:MAG: ABC transporter permease [Planctomycetota bacterium]|jgi:putative ABC transport system permease protein|nr:ABC transporter permease [Planctomycetota bacterium]
MGGKKVNLTQRARRLSLFLRLVTSSFIRRRARLFTALLALGIGATVISGLLTLQLEIPRQLAREFRSYGANLILVPTGEQGIMDVEDVEAVADLIPEEQMVGITPYRYASLSINRQPFAAAGIRFPEARKTSPYWRIDGEWPGRGGEVVIGGDIAETTRLAPGSRVRVAGHRASGGQVEREMTVTAVLHSGGVEDSMLFLELANLETILGQPGEVNLVEVSVDAPSVELQTIVQSIRDTVPSVTARLVRRLTHSEATVLGKLRLLLLLVVTVVLGLTLICVGTTMMTMVMERRQEIGLKKALGADNQAVAWEFVAEGGLLGLVGGGVGYAAGYFFAQLVSQEVFGRDLAPDLLLLPLTLALSMLVAVLAALLPLRAALAIEPAVVLRGE